MSSTSPGPPPEAALIRRGREALGISPEGAAARIKIKLSGRRWRQLEAGEESPGGTKAKMSDGQLAHMASVVGLRPERLESIGKNEAAAILRTIEDMEPAPPPSQFDQDMSTARAVLDEIERDPRLRARLHRIIEAASGHPPRADDSGEEGDTGHNVAG